MINIILLVILFVWPLTVHANEPFAVVELFTSEGCSSCPPADNLLSEITAKAERDNLPIYTLGFHVDYWNRLGWKDPFSQEIFTQRQNSYAQAFHKDTVYTPQMIINGVKGFSGADKLQAWTLIDEHLQKSSLLDIHLDVVATAPKIYEVNYQLSSLPTNSILNIALAEESLTSHVTAGENEGRVLKHTHTVRLFITEPLPKTGGHVILRVADEWRLDDLTLVAYVQNVQSMHILSAAKHNLVRSPPN